MPRTRRALSEPSRTEPQKKPAVFLLVHPIRIHFNLLDFPFSYSLPLAPRFAEKSPLYVTVKQPLDRPLSCQAPFPLRRVPVYIPRI